MNTLNDAGREILAERTSSPRLRLAPHARAHSPSLSPNRSNLRGVAGSAHRGRRWGPTGKP